MSDRRKNSEASVSSCDSRSSRDKQLNKILSLFVISRPKKSNRTLKRTVSLPSKNRPHELDEYLKHRGMEEGTESKTGKLEDLPFKPGHVKMLKDKLEKDGLNCQKSKSPQIVCTKNRRNMDNRPHSVFLQYGHDTDTNLYEEIPECSRRPNNLRTHSFDTDFEIESEEEEDYQRHLEVNTLNVKQLPSISDEETYEDVPYDDDRSHNSSPIYENSSLTLDLNDDTDTQTIPETNDQATNQNEDTDDIGLQNDVKNINNEDYYSTGQNEDTHEEILVPYHFKRVKSKKASGRSPHKKSSKEIIAKRKEEINTEGENSTKVSVKHRITQFENFYKAEERGETENFRKSLVLEMMEAEENMKRDGYSSDDNLEDLEKEERENVKLLYSEEKDTEVIYDIPFQFRDSKVPRDPTCNHSIDHYESPPVYVEEKQEFVEVEESAPYYSVPDDEFGEILFAEDLENGLYFVEAYNAENKELVIATLQVDRHCVYPNNISNVPVHEVLAEQGDDSNKTLVLLNQLLHSTSETSLNESSGSKRTTIYSTTSGDSCLSFEDLKLEDDEGIDVHSKHNSLYSQYNNARRETYCDNEGVVRIERIYVEPSDLESPKPNKYFSGFDELYDYEYVEFAEPVHESLSENDIKKDRLDYLLEEIYMTEIKYVDDLRKIVKEYKPFIQDHSDPNVASRTEDIFGNIEELYEKQQDFLLDLETAEGNLKDILKAFIDSEHLFKLYPQYISYKLKANLMIKELDAIIKVEYTEMKFHLIKQISLERQEQLNEKLNISAYLVTPVQRLGKYKLFLESILAQLQKEGKPIGTATMALDIIKKEMSNGNDAAAISSIQGCPIYQFGSFIMREKFVCVKPKRMEVMVFLFEEVIIFTTEDPKTIDLFFFYQSIKMSDLRIATFDDNNLQLIDYPKTKRRSLSSWKYTFILEAKSQKIKETWRQAIEGILWKQLQTLKENTLQRSKNRFSKRKTKASSSTASIAATPEATTSRTKRESNSESTLKKERRERIKSTGSSKFYV